MRVRFLLLAAVLGGCSAADETAPPSAPADEAGFIELAPIDYAIHHDGVRTAMTTSAARLWYAFQPADPAPDQKPLAVFWNGGPGASTGILFGLGTAKRTFDPALTGGRDVAPNPASWSSFANLLYIDARGTGFSYGLVTGAGDEATRSGELTVRNFNPFVDAADFVRVLLRFLDAHPALQRAPVVLVGESYGGIRASIALDMLLRHTRYGDGEGGYEDLALASEIESHLDVLLGEGAGLAATQEEVASQFGRLVLLQPRLSSPHQDAAGGPLLEAPGSPLFTVAAETGQAFVPCTELPQPCDPYANAMAFLDHAGRDRYDVRAPAGSTVGEYAAVEPRLTDPAALREALGMDPTSIEDLYANRRADAYRAVEPFAGKEPLAERFGALSPWDRYYRVELFDLLGPPFYGPDAQALGIERTGLRWGELFLEDARWVQTFITDAANDAVIYGPALPGALAMYDEIVESALLESGPEAQARPGQLRLRYRDGLDRVIRFPPYGSSGHSVTLREPKELASDVQAWLEEKVP